MNGTRYYRITKFVELCAASNTWGVRARQHSGKIQLLQSEQPKRNKLIVEAWILQPACISPQHKSARNYANQQAMGCLDSRCTFKAKVIVIAIVCFVLSHSNHLKSSLESRFLSRERARARE